MNRQEREALDRHITGNYGEDSVAPNLLEKDAQVAAVIPVPIERVAYTLCAALEGGSTYWAEGVKVSDYRGCEWAHEAIACGASFKVLHDGEVTAVENSLIRIGLTMTILAEKHMEHFSDVIRENEDAETGDIFFQLLCFGEVVYG